VAEPITHQTRRAAYQAVLPLAANRQEKAFEALRERPGGLTAGEVMEATGLTLNGARSALTELLNDRRVTTMSKRFCTVVVPKEENGRRVKVAVWTLPLGAS
jgi:hypothetical protein